MNKTLKIAVFAGFIVIAIYALAQTFQAPGSGIPGNGTMVGGSDYGTGCTGNAGAIPCFHPLAVNANGQLVTVGAATSVNDPCASSGVTKSSAVINISTATTTALVPVSGSTSVYVCGFSATISQVVTTANTLQFEYGTGTACASGPTVLTGAYGAGGVTAGAPLFIAEDGHGTIFKSPASNGICAVTTIGASGNFAGVLSFVQQ